MKRRTEKFSFDNGRGQKLAALVDFPAGEPLFTGVFAPCFTCTKESHAAHKICRALSETGAAMLRFDLTGLGGSEGDFAETTFSTRIADIKAALQAARNFFAPPRLLFGHSISGTAALAAAEGAAGGVGGLDVVATLGAPSAPSHVIATLKAAGQIRFEGEMAVMTIAGRPYKVRRAMADDMEAYAMAEVLESFDKKLFVFHAPQDGIVPFGNAEEIAARVPEGAEVVRLSGTATHLLEWGDADAALIAEVLLSALAPYG